jgi:flagellar motor component MotA
MDLATLVGLGIAVGMVVFGIVVGGVGFGYYVDPASILIVIGGSIGGVMASAPLSRILGVGKYIGILMNTPDLREGKLITDLVAFAERARREGLLALEDNLDEVENEFMRKGIQLVVDGTDPEIIKNILYTELNQINARHEDGINLIWLLGFPGSGFRYDRYPHRTDCHAREPGRQRGYRIRYGYGAYHHPVRFAGGQRVYASLQTETDGPG